MTRKHWDLIGINVLTVLTVVIVLLGWNLGPVRAILGTVFVLFVPGYAVALAVLPKRVLEFPVRIALGIGLSLSLSALGGLVLYGVGAGLEKGSWLALLGAIASLGSLAALVQRTLFSQSAIVRPALRLDLSQGVLLALILAALSGIGILARQSAINQPSEGFTELWIVLDDDTDDKVEIGVQNNENQNMTYDVVLRVDGRLTEEWTNLELASGQQWVTSYDWPAQTGPAQVMVVSLYRAVDSDTTLYRRVQLWR